MILRWEKEKHLERDLEKDGARVVEVVKEKGRALMDRMSGKMVFAAIVLLVECVSQVEVNQYNFSLDKNTFVIGNELCIIVILTDFLHHYRLLNMLLSPDSKHAFGRKDGTGRV